MYQAPENLLRRPYKPKPQDYWAYGISLYIYLMNYCPFVEWEETKEMADFEDMLEEMN